MVKKIGVSVMGIFVLLVIGFNIYAFSSRGSGQSALTGNVVLSNLPTGINLSLIAFVLQWVVLLLVVIFAYTRFLKHKKSEEMKIAGFVIPPQKTKAETHIDAFYDLLKEKQSLTTGTIAKAFQITKDQALEWSKVLEEHALVSIEYPAFADPEVKYITEEQRRNIALGKDEKTIKEEEKKEKEKIEKKKKEEEKQKNIGDKKTAQSTVVEKQPQKEVEVQKPVQRKEEQPKPGEISREELEKRLGQNNPNDEYKPPKKT